MPLPGNVGSFSKSKARIWPWVQELFLEPLQVVPLPLESGLQGYLAHKKTAPRTGTTTGP